MRRPSHLVRAIRAMTAVITLWCLGCSGFEPLLEAALGAESTVMTCDSDAGAMSAASPTDTPQLAIVSAAAVSHHTFDCGCGSCHSASPSTFAFLSAPHVAPAAAFTRIIALVSVVRTPLLPPPQMTA